MTDAFCTLGGKAVAGLTLNVRPAGAWWADVDLEGDDELAGRVALVCQGSTLSGTIDPDQSGTFGLQRRTRVVGGGKGWSSVLPRKGYQSDSGVKARVVADDVARAAGERLGDFMPAAAKLGANWTRARASGGATLEALSGGVPWWVDYAGVTHVRARPVAPAAPGSYEVLQFDPRSGRVELAIDDLTAVQVGSVLSERFDAPQTVQALTITLTGSQLRAEAVCADSPKSGNLLHNVVETLFAFFFSRRLLGSYRYRVVRMASDGRVDLQAVRKAGDVPDALLVPLWPGTPGLSADLREGSIVAVQFLEGDRSQPIVANFQGIQGPGYVPKSVTLGGKSGAAEVARKGDSVKCVYPPTVITGTMLVGGVPTPFTGVNVSTTGQILGVIQGGTPFVKAGNGS
jgi:hypothetical protein